MHLAGRPSCTLTSDDGAWLHLLYCDGSSINLHTYSLSIYVVHMSLVCVSTCCIPSPLIHPYLLPSMCPSIHSCSMHLTALLACMHARSLSTFHTVARPISLSLYLSLLVFIYIYISVCPHMSYVRMVLSLNFVFVHVCIYVRLHVSPCIHIYNYTCLHLSV